MSWELEPLNRWIFDRSQGPLMRVLACGCIGSIIAAWAILRSDHPERWLEWTALGAGMGYIAAFVLTGVDWLRRPDSPAWKRVIAIAVLVMSMVVIVGAVLGVIVYLDK